ncbi:hypothetical protein M3622_21565, partial [Bacillus subtilis]|nr:hypothetical protein [Bacillus subtilis]
RMRAAKGEYLLTPHDISKPEKGYTHLRGMPDCLAILVPDFPATEDALAVQLEWMNDVFAGRAWVGLTLHQHAMDDIHRGIVEHVADQYRVPVVATGNVVMHVRSRKPLQDTMTAIRLRKTVAECGYDLAPNAEGHLRSRFRLGNLYPTRHCTRRSTFLNGVTSHSTSFATNIPTSSCQRVLRTKRIYGRRHTSVRTGAIPTA